MKRTGVFFIGAVLLLTVISMSTTVTRMPAQNTPITAETIVTPTKEQAITITTQSTPITAETIMTTFAESTTVTPTENFAVVTLPGNIDNFADATIATEATITAWAYPLATDDNHVCGVARTDFKTIICANATMTTTADEARSVIQIC